MGILICMEARLLRFADRTMQGPYFHLTTVEWARNRMPGYHTHDYPEIFWLTQGECEHFINGRVEYLGVGEIVLMRAADAHLLRPRRGRGRFQFTNLSIAPDSFERLHRQYPDEVERLYLQGDEPARLRLSRTGLDTLNREVQALSAAVHGRFVLERTLMLIWSRFLPGRTAGIIGRDIPEWLQRALLQVQEPEFFSRGVTGFVAAAGRCHEHVTRECRRHLGKTPIQLVNESRLRRAAYALRMTSRSVLEITQDCGFENPAQFHRLFNAAFHTTPGRYRRECILRDSP